MNYGTGTKGSSFDVHWRRGDRSASDIAELLVRSHADKEELQNRLTELAEENTLLQLRCTAVKAELEEERTRLNGEIEALRSGGTGRREAESAARERLVKDEMERKIQSLQVELNKERQRAERLKERVAGCLCGEIGIEHVGPTQPPSSGMPERWIIRNSR